MANFIVDRLTRYAIVPLPSYPCSLHLMLIIFHFNLFNWFALIELDNSQHSFIGASCDMANLIVDRLLLMLRPVIIHSFIPSGASCDMGNLILDRLLLIHRPVFIHSFLPSFWGFMRYGEPHPWSTLTDAPPRIRSFAGHVVVNNYNWPASS